MRLGLTGGIGSGKSTVAALLRDQGAFLIDADAISRAATAAGGSAMPAIETAFGRSLVTADGALNRSAMRALVFSDASARQKLQAIVHPLIAAEISKQSKVAADGGAHLTVIDIPLLVESGIWRSQLDRVLVVDCTPKTQIQRVALRDGHTAEIISAMMQAQASRSQRLAAADAVVHNDGINLEQLTQLVRKIGPEFGL
jgi:dephospho-CoA kinase